MAEIIRLQNDDRQLEQFWRLRLRGLRDEPESFASSYEETAQMSMAELVELQQGRMNPSNVVFIAEEGGQFVGITGLYRETRLKTRHTAGIWGVYVLPEHRRRGMARALLQAAIAQARAWPDLDMLLLTVTVTQTAAIHLYQSQGFVTWGTQPKALCVNGVYLDEHCMALAL